MILPRHANPCRMEFSERTGEICSLHRARLQAGRLLRAIRRAWPTVKRIAVRKRCRATFGSRIHGLRLQAIEHQALERLALTTEAEKQVGRHCRADRARSLDHAAVLVPSLRMTV